MKNRKNKYLVESARITDAYLKMYSPKNMMVESYGDNDEIDYGSDAESKYVEDYDDDRLKNAISVIKRICSKFGAKVTGVVDAQDKDCVYVFIKIKDNNKTPGVGFDMNKIMGVGYGIQKSLDKAGIIGTVGAGGYTGNTTRIILSKKNPIAESTKIGNAHSKFLSGKMNENEVDKASNLANSFTNSIGLAPNTFDDIKRARKEARRKFKEEQKRRKLEQMKQKSLENKEFSKTGQSVIDKKDLVGNIDGEKSSGDEVKESIQTDPDDGFFVVVLKDGKWAIESSWAYREDANDRVRELKQDFEVGKGAKVLTKRGLRTFGLVNDNDSNWITGDISKVFDKKKIKNESSNVHPKYVKCSKCGENLFYDDSYRFGPSGEPICYDCCEEDDDYDSLPSNEEIETEYKNFLGNHEPLVETAEGVIYFQYDPQRNVFAYGGASNTGLLEDGTMEYDKSESMLTNLENLHDEIYEKYGYPKDE